MDSLIQQAENKAKKVLDNFWEPGELPVDPIIICRSLGLEILISNKLNAETSGVLEFRGYGSAPIITINSYDSTERNRFAVAHLLYRYLNNDDRSGRRYAYRAVLAGLTHDSLMIEANQFAAALLMPASMVKKYYDANLSTGEMATLFGTSEKAMEIRLKNLRLWENK
jgi:Zn-dependent peptidase ImmA (M78 family)